MLRGLLYPSKRFLSIFSCSLAKHFLSKAVNPTKWSESQSKLVFIILSKGEELESEGQTLTSSSQGLSLASRMTSNPYISKQDYLFLT
jgi:hypothetical protein